MRSCDPPSGTQKKLSSRGRTYLGLALAISFGLSALLLWNLTGMVGVASFFLSSYKTFNLGTVGYAANATRTVLFSNVYSGIPFPVIFALICVALVLLMVLCVGKAGI